ncbi:MAG: polysaccharide biosynthesis tyrosine autokinase [Actinobacteria bacterium]|nr:polysaccharide biosynthesis tyrosine autokinase [Actinomycetota bacterium]
MELRDYVRVLRKQWRLIALCVLLAAGTAAVVTMLATPQYRSEVTFFVSTPTDEASTTFAGGAFSQQRVRSYADIVAGPATAQAVAERLQGVDASDIAEKVTATVVPETVLLEATVTDASPQRAQQIAQGLADRFPDVVTALERPEGGGASPVKVSVVEQPMVSSDPVSPKPARNLALALVLGLLLGVGLAVLRETLDNTIKNPDDSLEAVGAATLGAIAYDPQASRKPLIVSDSPRSVRSEAFRQLRTNLQFVQVDGPLRSLVLTSSLPKEGKSTTACNLAIAMAQTGVRVCLVEGDLRRPRIADYLGLESAVGMTDVLIGRVSLDDALQVWGAGMLEVLPSGPLPPNPSELLSSRGMDELMKALEKRFDLVLIDAPPLLPVTDAAILSTLTDGAVLCVRARSTRKDQLNQAAGALRAVDAKILGVVLTMVPTKGPDAYQGYGYGYGSYKSDERKPQMSTADAERALEAPPAGAHVAEHPLDARPARTHERLSGDSAPVDRY